MKSGSGKGNLLQETPRFWQWNTEMPTPNRDCDDLELTSLVEEARKATPESRRRIWSYHSGLHPRKFEYRRWTIAGSSAVS